MDDILRSYVGLLSIGQSDFEAITNRREDDYFRQALGIERVPSAETLRQRPDESHPPSFLLPMPARWNSSRKAG